MTDNMSQVMLKKIMLGISEVFARAVASYGSKYMCYACKAPIGRFLPYRGGLKNVPENMIKLDVVGSDVDNFSCPRCRSHDRERHLLMYMDRLSIWDRIRNGKVLHFAPERNLSHSIRLREPASYIRADLYPVNGSIQKEDITNLSFSDNTFDVLIANHILEHVNADMPAMQEIFRVLVPGGLAILQTPYSPIMNSSFEDPSIVEEAARLQAFGQEDHVRVYGLDLFSRLEDVGLVSRVKTHDEILNDLDPSLYGVNKREPFICYQKPVDDGGGARMQAASFSSAK